MGCGLQCISSDQLQLLSCSRALHSEFGGTFKVSACRACDVQPSHRRVAGLRTWGSGLDVSGFPTSGMPCRASALRHEKKAVPRNGGESWMQLKVSGMAVVR